MINSEENIRKLNKIVVLKWYIGDLTMYVNVTVCKITYKTF
jgi:hypothetical protein